MASADRGAVDRLVVLTLALFFIYTGVEVSAGQWSFSVLTESRGLTTGQGGAWVATYWAGLTVGRLALSAVADWIGPSRVLALSMVGAIVAAMWFWLDVADTGVVGLPAMGLSLAGVFPTLVTLTPKRLGVARTNAMVGYQLAAASLGAAAVPWIIGRAVAASTLEAVGVLLVVATVAMAAMHVIVDRSATVATR